MTSGSSTFEIIKMQIIKQSNKAPGRSHPRALIMNDFVPSFNRHSAIFLATPPSINSFCREKGMWCSDILNSDNEIP